jgi:predicted RecA/RadA family phage recombinase
MAKAAFWQRGEALDYANDTNKKIEANTIVVYGSRIGVIGGDIPAGEKGSLHVTGVFELPKASEEITAGAEVYWDDASGNITTTAGSNTPAGFAAQAAASDDAVVLVKINA